jgi:hypothetical protein
MNFPNPFQQQTPGPADVRPGLAGAKWGALGVLAVWACLLFFRLGHYALWDDEAGTALTAKSILYTGDTSAFVDDHNIFAYRNGFELRNLKLRYLPPLPAFVTAASFALCEEQNAFTARLPFALFGLAAVALSLWWLRRAPISPPAFWLMAFALVGNVSLLLFTRQCRYYAPVLFFSVAVVGLYLRESGGRWRLLVMALLSASLFASSYLNYLALYGVLALDYVLWRRHERPLRIADWLALLGPQIVLCGALASVWNPLRNSFGGYVAHDSLGQKLTLFLWQWRDLNRCEFLCGGLLGAGAILAWVRRDRWLVRGLAALIAYVVCVTAFSPQPVRPSAEADVRYLVPLIPLGMALTARTLLLLAGRQTWIALLIGTVAFGSNLLHGGPLLWCGLRSTVVAYVGELLHPPQEPFTIAARWIDTQMREGESVWVVPDYMAYPLMFQAPKAVYAWQLTPPPAGQFRDMPKIHFKGGEPPDYILVGGPVVQDVVKFIQKWQPAGAHYELAAVLDCYWNDFYRPELFWHTFTAIDHYDRNTEAVYAFKRRRD